MAEEDIEQSLVEYAKDEAEETAGCLYLYRQLHSTCPGCRFREFCDYLALHLAELEAEG